MLLCAGTELAIAILQIHETEYRSRLQLVVVAVDGGEWKAVFVCRDVVGFGMSLRVEIK